MPEKPPILTRLTMDTGVTYQPAISPDGNLIAYASDRSGHNLDIWVQHVTRGEPIRLTSTDGNDYEPSFSPDGGTIAFVSDREGSQRQGGGIYLVPSLGGEAKKIADLGRRPRFSPDGQWIAYWVGNAHSVGQLYVVSVAGGPPKEVAPGWTARSPVWTPDGKHLVFIGRGNNVRDWWVANVDGGTPVSTGVLEECRRANLSFTDTGPGSIWPENWIPGTNEILFSARLGDSSNLWKIALSRTNWKLSGKPQRLTTGPGMDLQASSSSAGRIVFSSVNRNLDIWSLTVDPRNGTAIGELKQLTDGAARDHSPFLSRDGKRMAFESDRTGKQVVWTMDLETGKERRLTDKPSPFHLPRISPDGTQVAYIVWPGGGAAGALYVVPFSGGTPRKVTQTFSAQTILDWMPDGQTILCQSYPPPFTHSIVDVKTGGIRALAKHPHTEISGSGLSPDGRWFRFRARGRDQREGWFIARLWDTAAPPENEWIPTRGTEWSSGGDRTWGVNGHDGFNCIWTQRLDPTTKRMIGDEQPVYHFHGSRRSLTNVGFNPGLSVGPDKLVFTQGELTGNVWMAEWSKKP